MSFKVILEGHFFCVYNADRIFFALEKIVENCANFPISEFLAIKSTKVARLGKFIDKLNKICYNVNN